MPHLLLVCPPAVTLGADADPRTSLLSAAGRAQILPLADRIRRYKPDPIVGSPDPAPLETIRMLATALDSNMHTAQDLHERAASEAAAAAVDRFTTAVDVLLKTYRTATLAVVSGPSVISGYLAARCGVDSEITQRSLGTPSFVAVDRAGFIVTELASTI